MQVQSLKAPNSTSFKPESRNDLEAFLDFDTLAEAMENVDLIESVSFGIDSDSTNKNDIFVSLTCSLDHDDCPCYCLELIDQSKIGNFPIDLKTAENMAHFVSGLLGGKRVYHG